MKYSFLLTHLTLACSSLMASWIQGSIFEVRTFRN